MNILEYLSSHYHLTHSAVEILNNVFKPVQIKKGTVLQLENTSDKYWYIMREGLIKSCFSREGRERILSFYWEGDPIIVPVTQYDRLKVSLVAVEDSIVCYASKKEFEDSMKNNTELCYMGYQAVCQYVKLMSDDYLNFLWMNKTDIYKLLMSKHPDVIQRIPQKDIAAYLNITEQSLSRIRASIKD